MASIENLYWITFGAVAMWIVLRFVADCRDGIWDRDPGAPAPLDITPALERQRKLDLATERRVLEIEDQVIRREAEMRERVN